MKNENRLWMIFDVKVSQICGIQFFHAVFPRKLILNIFVVTVVSIILCLNEEMNL